VKGAADVVRFQADDEIDVVGEAFVAVGVHSQSTHHDVANVRRIQGSRDCIDAAQFHGLNKMIDGGTSDDHARGDGFVGAGVDEHEGAGVAVAAVGIVDERDGGFNGSR
jgi:hypothetical protein